jgi:hypothetical protein
VLLGWLVVGIQGAWDAAPAAVKSEIELGVEYQESMVYGITAEKLLSAVVCSKFRDSRPFSTAR